MRVRRLEGHQTRPEGASGPTTGRGRERCRQPLLAFQLLHPEQRWRWGHLEAEDRHDSVEVFLHGRRLAQELLRGTHGEEHRPRAKDRRCGGSPDPGEAAWNAGKGGRRSQAAKRELKAAYEDYMTHRGLHDPPRRRPEIAADGSQSGATAGHSNSSGLQSQVADRTTGNPYDAPVDDDR
jgi:hypothetical protein